MATHVELPLAQALPARPMLSNVHRGVKLPFAEPTHAYTCDGEYQYYHYVCDGFDDRGWGCGYRTLQTICSWLRRHHHQSRPEGSSSSALLAGAAVPGIHEIQAKLVAVGDKPSSFAGSREWIGCVEAAIVIDSLYDVSCKILHVPTGSQLPSAASQALLRHFGHGGSKAPIMMGGNIDASSRAILGVCSDAEQRVFVLTLDPHYVGGVNHANQTADSIMQQLQKDGWVTWQPLDSFVRDSFYNLCMPQVSQGTQAAF